MRARIRSVSNLSVSEIEKILSKALKDSIPGLDLIRKSEGNFARLMLADVLTL